MKYSIEFHRSVFKPSFVSAIQDASLNEALNWYDQERERLFQRLNRDYLLVKLHANGQLVKVFYTKKEG